MKTESIRNILMPIDFSEMSIQAIETAKRLAQRFGATIHLAHVHQLDYPAGFMGPVFSEGDLPESFEEHRSKQLAEELKTVASKSGLSSHDQTHLRTGASVFDEICKLSQKIPADLVVIPTHGRTGLEHVLLGSIAERVVQHSPCPVFVARENNRPSKTRPSSSINTILVPVDFSECSLAGLKYAILFTDHVAAKLILFHAVHLGHGMHTRSTFTQAAGEDTKRQMREFVRSVKFGELKFEIAMKIGSSVPEICAFAEDHDVDLIITSTHGRTGLEHVLIGSIAEQVVRHASCPVLVVPSHPKTRVAKLRRRSRSINQRAMRIAPINAAVMSFCASQMSPCVPR